MSDFWHASRAGFAFIGGVLSWFLGEMSFMLYVLIALAVCDYVTGVFCAAIKKELSSSVGFKGIAKKTIMFIFVGIGHLFDRLMQTGDVLRTAVVFFYIANESVSIIENAAVIGLPVPETLKNVLAQIKNKGDKGETKNE